MRENPITIVIDTPTYCRTVPAGHFAPGDQVLIVLGSQGSSLIGDRFTIVAPYHHQITDIPGWRLRDDDGGELSFLTASPKYLIHLDRDCPVCARFFRQLKRWLLPALRRKGLARPTATA